MKGKPHRESRHATDTIGHFVHLLPSNKKKAEYTVLNF